jgi:hypothetical protein
LLVSVLHIRHLSLSSSHPLPVVVNSSSCNSPLSPYQLSFHPTSLTTYPAKMPHPGSSLWGHKSDKDLLLAIIDNGALKGIDWKDISEKMTVKGYTFSHEACRYATHFYFLLYTLLLYLSALNPFLCSRSMHLLSSFGFANTLSVNTSKRSERNPVMALPTRPSLRPPSRAPPPEARSARA